MTVAVQAVKLLEIVTDLGGELVGDENHLVNRISSLAKVDAQAISFVAQEKYLTELTNSGGAGCVIIKEQWRSMVPAGVNVITTANPYLYYARLSNWWQQRQSQHLGAEPLIHPTANIDASAKLATDVRVGAFVYIGADANIGSGVVIGANSVIEKGVSIGKNTHCLALVYIGENCQIGENCLLQPGAAIGGDGFGFAKENGKWVRIAQLGTVLIGNEVEIGANSCVDRGAIDDTIIEDGVKIDNLIQIGHNVRVGANTAMASGVGIAGSTSIGKNCTIGGASGIGGHLQIVDNTHIAAATNISRSINKAGQYCGLYPFEEKTSWSKNASVVRHLAELKRQIKQIEQQIAVLQKS